MHVSYTARQRLAPDSRRWADRHTDKLSHCLRRWILDQSAIQVQLDIQNNTSGPCTNHLILYWCVAGLIHTPYVH
jgi:hypothetical protein